jgi:CRP/FNR family transcriptional regulator, anaerobic regulatory protein
MELIETKRREARRRAAQLGSTAVPAATMEAAPCVAARASNFEQVCTLLAGAPTWAPNHAPAPFPHLQLRAGERITTMGQPCSHVYLVKTGLLKCLVSDEVGVRHVTGFPMQGDLIGVDGMVNSRYMLSAVALSNCELIPLSRSRLTDLGRMDGHFQTLMCAAIGRLIVRERDLAAILRLSSASARLGRFLVLQGKRHAALGYSATRFNLGMTRQDIASYLSITLETVSRALAALIRLDLIAVNRRAIDLRDAAALESLRRLPGRVHADDGHLFARDGRVWGMD